MEILGYFATAVVAYLLGSIPTGFLMARSRGIDIRRMGSGNIGATNTFRVLGKPAGIFVLVVDGLKGWVACGLAAEKLHGLFGMAAEHYEPLTIIAAVAAILGHNYTCWLNFKGGKGIATSAGVLAALVPWAFVVILTIWVVVFALTRYVSLASIAAAFSLPFATWLLHYGLQKTVVTAVMTALAIHRHKSNITRLLQGTETRLSFKKKPTNGPIP